MSKRDFSLFQHVLLHRHSQKHKHVRTKVHVTQVPPTLTLVIALKSCEMWDHEILKHGSWKESQHPSSSQWPVKCTTESAAWPRWPEAGVPYKLCRKECWDSLAMSALDLGRNCRLWRQLLQNADPKGTQQCHWGEPVKWLNMVDLTPCPQSRQHPEMKMNFKSISAEAFHHSCGPSELKFLV